MQLKSDFSFSACLFGRAVKWGISWLYLDCQGAWCVEPYNSTHCRPVTLCWLSYFQLSWVIPLNDTSCYFIAKINILNISDVIQVTLIVYVNVGILAAYLVSACSVVWRTSVDVRLSTSLTVWWEGISHVSWYPLAVASVVELYSSREPRWRLHKFNLRCASLVRGPKVDSFCNEPMRIWFLPVSALIYNISFCASVKGSGKTCLAKALCMKAVEVLDAHIEVLDSKKLKGGQRYLCICVRSLVMHDFNK